VSAPLITTGVVDLPSVGKSKQRPEHVVELIIKSDELFRIKLDGREDGPAVPLNKIAARVRQMQGDDATTPVVISADRNVKYEAVVKLMDTLQRAGIQRVGLSVKNST
jgi:biopolymer transport protein TolR